MGLSNSKIVPMLTDNDGFCTDISILCATRELIEKVIINSTNKLVFVGIFSLHKNREANGISICVEEELDKNIIAKIDAIINNKFRVEYKICDFDNYFTENALSKKMK